MGFRYRAKYGARHFSVTGWVRNNDDGSVTVEVQGRPENIDMWLSLLTDDEYIRIYRTVSKEIEPVEDERGFRVRYDAGY